MLKSLILVIPVLLLAIAAPPSPRSVLAQAAQATASALYQEVSNYPRQKQAELRRQGKPIDRETSDRLYREQRELAARYAAQLAALPDLSGADYFFLGRLYDIADKGAEVIKAMRRFLAEQPAPEGATAQPARYMIVIYAARSKAIDEAESVLAEYLRHEPQSLNNRFQMEMELAIAQNKAKQYDRAVAHAGEAYRSTGLLKTGPTLSPRERDEWIVAAAAALADAYSGMKKKKESLAAIMELYQRALELPSANLIRLASKRFADREGEIEAALRANGTTGRGAAPELDKAEWIDQPPVKLADLRGNVVLLDFWYEWCGPCRAAFPTLKSWHKKHKDRGLVVLGLTELQGEIGGREMTVQEELGFLLKFKQQHDLSYGVVVGTTRGNLRNYSISAFPTAVLIDRRGAVRYIGIGYSPKEMEDLQAMIEKLLKEPAQSG